jgi:membrane protein YdbS with pleckstrin-like domain
MNLKVIRMTKMDEDYIKVIKIKMLLMWILMFCLPLIPAVVGLGIVSHMIEGVIDLPYIEVMFWVFLVILIAAPFLSLLIAGWWGRKWYENFEYELEPEGVKLQSGVWRKVRKFIPYNRIQDLAITQGVWERRYELSTILIETAGYGGGLYPEGVIPGLKNPEPVMDAIRSKMKQ